MYKHILVPIVFDEEHDGTRAIEVALRLAPPDAQVTLLHVMEEVPGYAISYLPEGFRAASRNAVEAAMQEKAKAFPHADTAVIEGQAGRSILGYAEAHNVDCIVISSHRPGLGDYLLGSTTTRVVRHAQCSVHVIR